MFALIKENEFNMLAEQQTAQNDGKSAIKWVVARQVYSIAEQPPAGGKYARENNK